MANHETEMSFNFSDYENFNAKNKATLSTGKDSTENDAKSANPNTTYKTSKTFIEQTNSPDKSKSTASDWDSKDSPLKRKFGDSRSPSDDELSHPQPPPPPSRSNSQKGISKNIHKSLNPLHNRTPRPSGVFRGVPNWTQTTLTLNPSPKKSLIKATFEGHLNEELPAKIREPQLPVATSTPAQLRDHFSHNLRRLEGPPVIVTNNVDDSSPPVSFEFINSSIICQGVEPVDKGFMVGCECTADRKVDRARICGSDDSECSCVYQADSKDVGLSYYPYLLSRQCLTKHFLTTRDHIHECNEFCCCGPDCKNRVVQHGRKVPLEIFKTADRGWGLRCPVPLLRGQFIDTYRGEIITGKEADRRGVGATGPNYLFDFDHFNPRWISPSELQNLVTSAEFDKIKRRVASGDLDCENLNGVTHWTNPKWLKRYVCDGKNFGGPMRFMNHSCEPNCRIFTASTNHADQNLYEIAFFAIHDIEENTELVFDYQDSDEPTIITDEMADVMEKKNGYRPEKCLCGAKGCCGYFFH